LIQLAGESISLKSPRQALQKGLALVPEDRLAHGIVAQMTLSENVSLPILGRLGKPFVKRNREKTLTETWIQKLGVVCRGPGQPIAQLSGGNQQKLVIGKWLETNPKLLIVDEPTRGVDVGAKAAVHELMRSLASQGLAILAVSSDLPEVLTIADRILVMREGRVVKEFARGEATEESIMLAATGQGVNAA
jgi:ABC-type sugar transport system ATPase subunit